MAEFTVKGIDYRTEKMEARRQFHVARRLAGLLGEVPTTMASGGDMAAAAPLMKALSSMPDAELDYVINACLNVVRRKQGDVWAPVVASNGAIMFVDIADSLPAMISLVAPVLRENIQGFLSEPPPEFLEMLGAKA